MHQLQAEAPVCIVGDQHLFGLNFRWLKPPFCRSQIDALLGSGTLIAEHGEGESQRLKSESHSNKPHSISPSSPPVLGSIFPLDVCCSSIFSTVSPASLYTLFFFKRPWWSLSQLLYVSKNFFPLNVCLRLTILNFMFLFPCLLFPYFPLLRPHEMGAFHLPGKLRKWHWRHTGMR